MLGESHYGETGTADADFTRATVKYWALERRSRFFTSAAKLVLGTASGVYLSDEDRRRFWHSVAFYNYVPTFVGETPRVRPTDQLWNAAVTPFRSVIRELRPHAILVLGAELWHRLEGLRPFESHPDLFRLKISSNEDAIVTMSQHPSSFKFRIAEWQPRVRAMLELTGRQLTLVANGGSE